MRTNISWMKRLGTGFDLDRDVAFDIGGKVGESIEAGGVSFAILVLLHKSISSSQKSAEESIEGEKNFITVNFMRDPSR